VWARMVALWRRWLTVAPLWPRVHVFMVFAVDPYAFPLDERLAATTRPSLQKARKIRVPSIHLLPAFNRRLAKRGAFDRGEVDRTGMERPQ